MSHFTVLVIGDDVDEQLYPFSENLDYSEEEDRKFLEFYGEGNKEIEEEYANGVVEYGDDLGKKFTEVYPKFKSFLKEWHGFEKDPHTGKLGYWRNPKAKWDWFTIGGMWTGFFKLKSGAKGVTGSPGLMTSPAKPGFVDQVKLKNVDFLGMEEHEASLALERYERAERLLGGSIPELDYLWSDLISKKEYEHLNMQDKRDLYWKQPSMLLKESKLKELDSSSEDYSFLNWIDMDSFQMTKEEYIQKSRENSFSTFAVLKDGEWFERGKMGWWGSVSNEKSSEDWGREFSKLVRGLPKETLLTVVDCHI